MNGYMLRPSVNKGVNYVCRPGFTLPEMLISVSIMAIVAAIALPTFYALRETYTSNGTDTMIGAALASAKAMAAKEQKYAGIRFQCAPDPEKAGQPGDQYIIFIIQDNSLPTVNGFRACRGVDPIRLPVNQGVMDMYVRDNYSATTPLEKTITSDTDISDSTRLWDTTTFSIIFSPSGRIVTHDVQVWNRDGVAAGTNTSADPIFNSQYNVDTAKIAMFYQDDKQVNVPQATSPSPFLAETSRKSLMVYDKRALAKFPAAKRYSGYLQKMDVDDKLFINAYTGTIIENQNLRNATK
jgi:prepilin-type N-terminal cleavage/methylation domain-containing protein